MNTLVTLLGSMTRRRASDAARGRSPRRVGAIRAPLVGIRFQPAPRRLCIEGMYGERGPRAAMAAGMRGKGHSPMPPRAGIYSTASVALALRAHTELKNDFVLKPVLIRETNLRLLRPATLLCAPHTLRSHRIEGLLATLGLATRSYARTSRLRARQVPRHEGTPRVEIRHLVRACSA